jgi:hypothetical protein
MAAMAMAADTGHPALGLYYLQERPTLSDAMEAVIDEARNTGPAGG